MSALTDLFTSLANKVRSKLGTSTKYTPAQAINAIDAVYTKGVTDTKVGTATAGDVLTGKTFTNSSTSGLSGSMENLSTNNRYQHTSNNSTPTIIGDAGYFTTVYDKVSQSDLGDYFEIRYNGSPNKNASDNTTGNGYISTNTLFALPSQTKTVSPTTSSQTVSPDSNKVLKSVTVNAISTQEKSITATTSQQTVTPDSGKYLTKVTVNAQSHNGTKEITAGTSSSTTDMGAAHNNRYVKVNPTPSQTKSASPSTSAQTITPDSGKLLSSVSISAISPQRSEGIAATTAGRDDTGPYVYVPYGWYSAESADVQANYTRLTEEQGVAVARKQEKTVTAGTSAASVTPDSNYLLSKVTYNPTPSQTKSASPSTSAQTITPDSGKLLSSVSISAIPTQTKSVTATTSAQTVTPDSGKFLTSVTVNAQSHSGTKEITAGTSSSTTDMGAAHNNRYVKVNPTPSQTKSASPSTSDQTISPDSGKLLSSVSISAISPQRSLGTAATGSGIDDTGPYVYMPYGYWPEYSEKSGSSYTYLTAAQAVAACPKQEKTVTAGTSATSVTPDSNYLLSKVTYNPTPSQTKSASPSTSAQTITPDSGKLLSSVTVGAISPVRNNTGEAALGSGIDNTGPYVHFPYGWYADRGSGYYPYTRLTAAQAVNACPKQEKTVTSSRSAQTVTPDSDKLLSKVTVNALAPTGTFDAGSTRSTSIDMGATSNYRYVNTNGVSNTNSGTYTPSTHGTALDMGATNTYRYVNTTNAYNAGVDYINTMVTQAISASY